jgi:hypothetical protein
MNERFTVRWCGHYKEETHPFAWGVCDNNSNAIVGWGNPSKQWAKRIADALNTVAGHGASCPECGRNLTLKLACTNKKCSVCFKG